MPSRKVLYISVPSIVHTMQRSMLPVLVRNVNNVIRFFILIWFDEEQDAINFKFLKQQNPSEVGSKEKKYRMYCSLVLSSFSVSCSSFISQFRSLLVLICPLLWQNALFPGTTKLWYLSRSSPTNTPESSILTCLSWSYTSRLPLCIDLSPWFSEWFMI